MGTLAPITVILFLLVISTVPIFYALLAHLDFSPDLFLLKGLREHATISFILNISRQAQYLEIIGLWPGLMLRVKHELFLLCVRN